MAISVQSVKVHNWFRKVASSGKERKFMNVLNKLYTEEEGKVGNYSNIIERVSDGTLIRGSENHVARLLIRQINEKLKAYECDDVYRVDFMSKLGMHVYARRVTVSRHCLDTCDGLIRFEDV